MRVWRRRLTGAGAFALLALVTELTGRSITLRIDRAFHVMRLAPPSTPYYPFLLAGIRAVAALALAAVAWRIVRAHVIAAAGQRLLRAAGHRHLGIPRVRLTLSAERWLLAFGATSLWYLLQNDGWRVVSAGRWPMLAPWLHTYALPVFAVLSVLLSLGWGAVRDWLAEVESYTAATIARVCRILRGHAAPQRRPRPASIRAPRLLFGLDFESRPPPLAA